MKLFKKVLFVGIVFLVLFFISFHVYVNIKGKTLLTVKLQETFKRKARVGTLTTVFPAAIHIKDIEVEGLFRIDEVIADGGLFDIFRKNFRLSTLKIIHPFVTIEKGIIQAPLKDSPVPLLIPSFIPADLEKKAHNEAVTPNLNPMDIPKGRFLLPLFYVNNLILFDGIFNFIDKSVGGAGVTIKIERVNIKVENLNLVNFRSKITSFQIDGIIPWEDGREKGTIAASGWLDLFKKDMQASLKIERIDGIQLYPYYSQWVNLQKTGIEKARLNFTSNISGLNNNVTAECHLELDNLIFKEHSASEQEDKAEKAAKTVMNIIKVLNQGKIVFDFTIRTKMDKPILGLNNIKKDFGNKLAQSIKNERPVIGDVVMLPAVLLEGTLKGAADISKAFVSGSFAVGSEIKKSLELAFKKEPKE